MKFRCLLSVAACFFYTSHLFAAKVDVLNLSTDPIMVKYISEQGECKFSEIIYVLEKIYIYSKDNEDIEILHFGPVFSYDSYKITGPKTIVFEETYQ